MRRAVARRTTQHELNGDLVLGREIVRKVLLVCGVLSSLLHVAANVLGALRWEDYSSVSQTVSELMALDAPSRPLVVPLFLAYGVLVIAFALGVWGSAGENRALRVTAGLLLGYGVVGLVGPFAPVHQRGVERSLTDTVHMIVTSVIVFVTLFAIGVGASALGKSFARYSISTMLVVLVFGALAGRDGSRIAAGLPTPWVGVTERICIGGFLLWVAALAVALLRSPAHGRSLGH